MEFTFKWLNAVHIKEAYKETDPVETFAQFVEGRGEHLDFIKFYVNASNNFALAAKSQI